MGNSGDLSDRLFCDFNAHFLPRSVNGKINIRSSAEIIDALYQIGAGAIVATPEYDAKKEKVDDFIKRRDIEVRSIKRLLRPKDMPIYIGAEVALAPGLNSMTELDKLCIASSSVILIKMPDCRWNDRVLDTLISVRDAGYKVIIAHPEAYDYEAAEALFSLGFKGQLNILSLVTFNSNKRKRILEWVNDNLYYALGSDISLNTKFSPLKFKLGLSILGKDNIELINSFTYRLLDGAKSIESINSERKNK